MFKLPIVSLKPARHKNAEVIKVVFEKDESILQALRQSGKIRWSQTMHCWYLPYSDTVKQDVFKVLEHKAWIDYSGLTQTIADKTSPTQPKETANNTGPKALPCASPDILQKVKVFKYYMRSKRYSENTIGTYSDALKIFLRYYSDKDITDITNDDLITFNNDYIIKNKFSGSHQNQVVNAVKLFFRTVENTKLNPELVHRPKREKTLPNVLSKEEVKLILEAHGNIKHKAMLILIYSCGLRRSELLNLKLNDIDSKRGLVIIRKGKGRKDRITPLSEKVLNMLREYFKAYQPKDWLFEGQNRKGQYDERSLANVLKQALEKSKIDKPVSLHWLRHSYATHLLENGTDLRYIQEILGHSSSKTTEIYTHVSNKSIQKIVSPFDTL